MSDSTIPSTIPEARSCYYCGRPADLLTEVLLVEQGLLRRLQAALCDDCAWATHEEPEGIGHTHEDVAFRNSTAYPYQ